MNGLFGVNGIGGFLVAVVLLLAIVFWFGSNAVATQKRTATQSYTIVDPMGLKADSTANAEHLKIEK